MIEIVRADSWLARRRFYSFPHELYRDEEKWGEPVVWGGRGVLNARQNELLRSPHVLLMAKEKNRVLARVLTGTVGQEGYFALFDAHPCEEAIRRLMDEAVAWQKSRGISCLTGPIAPTSADLGGGILCEGFGHAAAYCDAYHAPYYGEYLERCGFDPASEWMAYRMESDRFEREKYRRLAEWVRSRFGFSVRLDIAKRPREFARAVSCVMDAGGNQEVMNRVVGRLEKELADELCPVVYCGKTPVGFLLTIKGPKKRPRIVTLWVHEKWRRMGVTAVLFDAFIQSADRLSIGEADASQVHTDNKASRMSIEAAGGRVFQRYRQYQKMI